MLIMIDENSPTIFTDLAETISKKETLSFGELIEIFNIIGKVLGSDISGDIETLLKKSSEVSKACDISIQRAYRDSLIVYLLEQAVIRVVDAEQEESLAETEHFFSNGG